MDYKRILKFIVLKVGEILLIILGFYFFFYSGLYFFKLQGTEMNPPYMLIEYLALTLIGEEYIL